MDVLPQSKENNYPKSVGDNITHYVVIMAIVLKINT